jgi:hypothetical protein
VLGVGKDVAINFSLASGLLVLIASVGAAAAGSATALALPGGRRVVGVT